MPLSEVYFDVIAALPVVRVTTGEVLNTRVTRPNRHQQYILYIYEQLSKQPIPVHLLSFV